MQVFFGGFPQDFSRSCGNPPFYSLLSRLVCRFVGFVQAFVYLCERVLPFCIKIGFFVSLGLNRTASCR
jgi:type III secretory pathway component EscS